MHGFMHHLLYEDAINYPCPKHYTALAILSLVKETPVHNLDKT